MLIRICRRSNHQHWHRTQVPETALPPGASTMAVDHMDNNGSGAYSAAAIESTMAHPDKGNNLRGAAAEATGLVQDVTELRLSGAE